MYKRSSFFSQANQSARKIQESHIDCRINSCINEGLAPLKAIPPPSRHPIHDRLPKIPSAFFSSEPPFSKTIRFEERVGAIFILPAPALGALLGGSAGSGKSVEVLLASPRMVVVLLVITAIFAPLAIWGSVWMNRVAFGKALDGLRRNIQALEEI